MNTTINRYWGDSEESSILSRTPGEGASQEVNPGELLDRSAERTGQKPPAICGEQTVSYETLSYSTDQFTAFTRGRRSLDRSVWYHGGYLLTFLATAEDTQGKFALIEAVGRRGNNPPPHIHHREDEALYVLEGEITFSVGGQTIKATPGTMVFLPRGVVHSFVVDSEQMRVLILVTPAGLEEWFKEFSVPAPAMTLPQVEVPYSDIQRMLETSPRYGLEFVLPKS